MGLILLRAAYCYELYLCIGCYHNVTIRLCDKVALLALPTQIKLSFSIYHALDLSGHKFKIIGGYKS